jgi:hypothetical protein
LIICQWWHIRDNNLLIIILIKFLRYKMKSTLLWIATVLFTIVIAYYQKTTGPTYPVRGTVNLIEQEIKFKLLRSYNSGIDMPISFEAADPNIIGQIKFKRFKSHDDWTIKSLKRDGILLSTTMPSQPPAGKLIYEVYLGTNLENLKSLTKEPVIARYKGAVPAYFLIPHIFFMFLAMLFASRTGVEAIIDGPKIATQTQMTVLFLFIGGIILGPIVQKFAFGAFWTGWPFGYDLTDNKTLIAMIFWVIAFWRTRKDSISRFWPITAAIVLLAIYLIPHSVLGSEIDYTKLPNQ